MKKLQKRLVPSVSVLTFSDRIVWKNTNEKGTQFHHLLYHQARTGICPNQGFCIALWGISYLAALTKKNFEFIKQNIRRSDIVSITGNPSRTARGELTLTAEAVKLLAPCYHQIPEWNNLLDSNIRYRQRYIDMLVNKDTNAVSRFTNLSNETDISIKKQDYFLFARPPPTKGFHRSRNSNFEYIRRRRDGHSLCHNCDRITF